MREKRRKETWEGDRKEWEEEEKRYGEGETPHPENTHKAYLNHVSRIKCV